MTLSEVKRNIWRNTVSNYAALILRTGLGLLVFRMLYQGLPKEAFGFWMLLWSVFGYGILLDFGFGLTAQKRVAELSVHQDWDQLSRVLSTIFFVYCAIALTMILIVLSASHFLIGLFEVTPENRELFREILIYFFCGMGIAFPLGMFTEILRGQQRIRVNNYIAIGTQIVNFALLATALHYQWGLKSIFLIALSTAIGQYMIAAFVAMHPMKSVRIRPGYFSWKMVRHTTQFSVYAYLVMVGYMIMTKTDQLVIGSVMAVSAIAFYQPGAKIAELLRFFMGQLSAALQPAAAHLHASGDRGPLQRLLINGTRYSALLATPLYLISAFHLDEILKVLTGNRAIDPSTYWVAQVLVFWTYSYILTHNVYKQVAVMCGHEKRLMQIGLAEAGTNLGVSVVLLVVFQDVFWVAVGTLIPALLYGWGFLWRWAAKEAELSPWGLAQTVLFRNWLGSIPLLAFLSFGTWIPWEIPGHNFLNLALSAGLAGIVAFIGIWVLAITPWEREQLLIKVRPWIRKVYPV